MRLQGKVIVVTGSTSGIGEGIARRVAAEGAIPVIHGLEHQVEAGKHVAAEIGGFFVSGDLSNPETPEQIIQRVVEKAGRVDGLVNNAGVSWRGGIEASSEFFDKVFAINTRAPFLMIQAALPHLKSSKGCVVNIGSGNARHGVPDLLPYSMSKAALASLTRALSSGLVKDGVRINGINLGWTLTEGERNLLIQTHQWEENWPETIGANQPLGRLLLPEDAASIVAYLLSQEAKMITGQIWDFDQRSFGG